METLNTKIRKKKKVKKMNRKMRSKLFVVFSGIVILLCGLIGRLMYIEYTSGEKYKKIVLSQLSYDSRTIPYQRGDIVDTNGTVLATSVAVYNVILDGYLLNSGKDQQYVEPTIDALVECFPDLKRKKLNKIAREQASNRYIILLRELSYDEIQDFVELQEAEDEKGKKLHPNIKGVWFEKEFKRTYPLKTLASAVLGFTSDGNVGTIGLENYYDSLLNGTNGRQYGYLNSDSSFEKTIIEPKNGNTLVCTIDSNIQKIVEKKIQEFNDAYENNYRTGDGSLNTAVLVMNPNTGEILAMADYPTFDSNDPRNLSAFYSKEELKDVSDEEQLALLNQLWQNFCVTSTYEPGSVQKPFTEACGLETGKLNTEMTFTCNGFEKVGDKTIHCVNRGGHGVETMEKALMDSCNDALMQMVYRIGIEDFTRYQSIFGFGKKTGIDLPGEASTATLVYTADTMRIVDLATNSFGQNYNCTMVQMASAFSSLINGGNYYQPHVIRKIEDSAGNTISTIEPTLLKKIVSEETSGIIKEYLRSVVSDGTGATAKVDGYSMGGKTGTAQKMNEKTHKRLKGEYLVSFLGYVPYENPQLVFYCVVDEPNVKDQAHSTYAQNIVREILEEILPYVNIYPDEELTGANKDLDITGNNAPGEPDGAEDSPAEMPQEDAGNVDDGTSGQPAGQGGQN